MPSILSIPGLPRIEVSRRWNFDSADTGRALRFAWHATRLFATIARLRPPRECPIYLTRTQGSRHGATVAGMYQPGRHGRYTFDLTLNFNRTGVLISRVTEQVIPIVSWTDVLVSLAAHEFRHGMGINGSRKGERICEHFEAEVLRAWQAVEYPYLTP